MDDDTAGQWAADLADDHDQRRAHTDARWSWDSEEDYDRWDRDMWGDVGERRRG